MNAPGKEFPQVLHRSIRVGLRRGILGLILSLLLWGLSRVGSAFGADDPPAVPPLCTAWHRGQGDSHPVDLGRMKRSYDALKGQLTRSIDLAVKRELDAPLLPRYDAGLPACGRGDKRLLRPEQPLPTELLGKKLWFGPVGAGRTVSLPGSIQSDPGAILFATRVERVESLSELSEALGRPVSLAPSGLAEALGVRCAPAVVLISPKGEVEIDENP